MTMMIAREEAVVILGDARMATLKSCFDSAWDTFQESIRPLLPLCSPTGMANILRELVIQQVRDRFVEVAGVVIHDRNVVGGRFLVEIDQRVLLSFKKLTRDFLTSNNPTDTSRAFDLQDPDLEGLPSLPRITVGYQLGAYGTVLSGVWLAFVVGEENIWYHDLQSGATSIEIEFPKGNEIEFPREKKSAADKEREAAERKKARQERGRRVQGTDRSADDDAEDDGGER